jgi:hypothetical protein
MVVILQGDHRGGDGNITTSFLGIEVRNGISVSVAAHTDDSTGHIQQALSQSGLAAATVAQQNNVTDRVNSIHDEKAPFGKAFALQFPFVGVQDTRLDEIIHELFTNFNDFFSEMKK